MSRQKRRQFSLTFAALCRDTATNGRDVEAEKRARGVRAVAAFAALSSNIANAQTHSNSWDEYLWQTCRTANIPASMSNLVTEPRAEVQKILDTGPLAPMRYEPRQRGRVHQGWMCLEVGRYLSQHVKDAALERHSEGLKKYPLFSLLAARSPLRRAGRATKVWASPPNSEG